MGQRIRETIRIYGRLLAKNRAISFFGDQTRKVWSRFGREPLT